MTEDVMHRLTLTPGGIYAWTMFPGYGDEPYRSPIEVIKVIPCGGRTYELDFVNMFYAVGMQRMRYTLQTLRREKSYLAAQQLANGTTTDRVVIVEKMTVEWVRQFLSNAGCNPLEFFDDSGAPIPAAFRVLVSSQ